MFQTDRLIIKPFEKEDQERMILLLTNEQIKKTYMIPDFDSVEKVIQLFERMRELSYSEERFVRGIFLDDKVIGMVNDVGIEDEKIEVGYMLDPECHNQGYGTEMLRGTIAYLFEKGYVEVMAGAFEGNIASRRIMEKAGMIQTDVVDEIEYRGVTYKCANYSIKKEK